MLHTYIHIHIYIYIFTPLDYDQTASAISTYDQLNLTEDTYDVAEVANDTPLIIKVKSIDGLDDETGLVVPWYPYGTDSC